MTITRKINKPLHPPLIMNNTIINQVTEHKHLGLDISNDGRVDHAWIVAMSLFNVIADSRGLSTITYKLVLSANSFIDEWISVTMSFINIIKNRG
jgi:hypothetical protein